MAVTDYQAAQPIRRCIKQRLRMATSDLPDLTQPPRRPGVAPLKPLQRKETR